MPENINSVPVHVGLILDGNRRWAKERGLSANEGHRQGYKNLKTIAKVAMEYGVRYVSAYVFSSENWKRDPSEITEIMKLMSWALKHEVKDLHKDNIRIRVIGSKTKLGTALTNEIHNAEKLTENNTKGTILVCLDYGGQQEIVEAVKKIILKGLKHEAITTDTISDHLYAPDIPPPDLIIRTSGEQRLSNFMVWQSAYSELMFSPKNWPDFTEADLIGLLEQYGKLQRRFGG